MRTAPENGNRETRNGALLRIQDGRTGADKTLQKGKNHDLYGYPESLAGLSFYRRGFQTGDDKPHHIGGAASRREGHQCLHRAAASGSALHGEEIRRRRDARGLATDFVSVPEGFSRINCKLKNAEGTEINGCGPSVGEKEVSALVQKLDPLTRGDILVLSGSIPKPLPADFYARILARLSGRGVLTVVDATGASLLAALPYHPFLVKPNIDELSALFGASLTDRASALPYARELQRRGAENVLVSLGREGALLAAGDGSVMEAAAPKGKLINAVGAGDSMVAGFVAGWLESRSYAHAFRMGLAAGSASAFSEHLAERENVEQLLSRMENGRNG